MIDEDDFSTALLDIQELLDQAGEDYDSGDFNSALVLFRRINMIVNNVADRL